MLKGEYSVTETNGRLHVTGNGMVCCYAEGSEIKQIFGPCYSSPSFLTLSSNNRISDAISIEVNMPGIYTHCLKSSEDEDLGGFVEFSHTRMPVYIRRALGLKQAFILKPSPACGRLIRVDALIGGMAAYLIRMPAGTYFYETGEDGGLMRGYPIPHSQTLVIASTGGLKTDSSGCLLIGGGDLVLSFSWEDTVALDNVNKVLSEGLAAAEMDARAYISSEESKRIEKMPFGRPDNPELDAAARDTAYIISAQQGIEGGVIAGHRYHLAYVRDQYGAARGMIALGMPEKAGAILRYYSDIFSRYGLLKNAQGVGVDAFHEHENDLSEITGYIVLAAMDFYDAAGDGAFLAKLAPMLKWALDSQRRELFSGMLPFNGDETYIAGGIIPRTVLADGSCEATMLYHTAIVRSVPVLRKLGLVSEQFAEDQYAARLEIERNFAANFITAEGVCCNQPTLRGLRPPRKYRHGVRECGHGFGWSFRDISGRYVCPECVAKDELGPAGTDRYLLNSVLLDQPYIGSTLLPDVELQKGVSAAIKAYDYENRIGSRAGGDMALGYDFGMLLNVMKPGHTSSSRLTELMLSIRDDFAGWTEYYAGNVSYGTQLRPWESGVNIEALLKYDKSASRPL